MADVEELRTALQGLIRSVRGDEARAAQNWLVWLEGRSGREWLLMDTIARGRGWDRGIVVGTKWAERSLGKQSDLLSEVVVSWHADGRFRERATRRLASRSDRVSAAALAVRCLDHVPQVRDQAVRALLQQPTADTIDIVIGVLTAASPRAEAQAALTAYISRVLAASDGVETLLSYADHTDRGVGRSVVAVALDRELLTPERVFELARRHIDPLVRSRAIAWLTVRSSEMLARLLDARFVDSRVAALQHVPDRDLPLQRLRSALLDRSPRVRVVAQERSRGRDLDPASVYRAQLDNAASQRAVAALSGLGGVGTAQDAPRASRFLDHPQPRVRAAAVGALAALADADEVTPLVTPLLQDPSTKMVTAATRALVRVDAGPDAVAAAWLQPQVVSRRGAWKVSRAAGGWDRVLADLRAANDPDPVLAQNGRAGLSSWLVFGAARTWQRPADAQQASIAELLRGSALGRKASEQVAFHAGVTWDPPGEHFCSPGSDEPSVPTTTALVAADPAGPNKRWRSLLADR